MIVMGVVYDSERIQTKNSQGQPWPVWLSSLEHHPVH